MLGTLLFESADFERAQRRSTASGCEGPFSNQALLRAGWADVSAKHFDRALVPWESLVQREPTDAAVQEAMLAVPQAYAELQVHGRAALLYGRALEAYSRRSSSVDASIGSIRDGQFLQALVREEIKPGQELGRAPALAARRAGNLYLTELMASHDFQTALQNYLDLDDLRAKLVSWQTNFDAFEDMIRLRAAVLRAAAARSRRAVPRTRRADAPATRAAPARRRRACTRCSRRRAPTTSRLPTSGSWRAARRLAAAADGDDPAALALCSGSPACGAR